MYTDTHSPAGRKQQLEQVLKMIRHQLKSRSAWVQVWGCVWGFVPQLKNKNKPWGNQRCTVGGLISLLTRRNKPRTLDRRSFPSRWAALKRRRIRRKNREWAPLLLLMNEHYSSTTSESQCLRLNFLNLSLLIQKFTESQNRLKRSLVSATGRNLKGSMRNPTTEG